MELLYLLKGMALGVAVTCSALACYISFRDLIRKPKTEPNSARDYAERWLKAWSEGWKRDVPRGMTDAVEQAILAYAQQIKDGHDIERALLDKVKVAVPDDRLFLAVLSYREVLRENKQYQMADELRKLLVQAGYTIQDKSTS